MNNSVNENVNIYKRLGSDYKTLTTMLNGFQAEQRIQKEIKRQRPSLQALLNPVLLSDMMN